MFIAAIMLSATSRRVSGMTGTWSFTGTTTGAIRRWERRCGDTWRALAADVFAIVAAMVGGVSKLGGTPPTCSRSETRRARSFSYYLASCSHLKRY